MSNIINLKVVISHLPTVVRIVDPVNRNLANGTEIIKVLEVENANLQLSQIRKVEAGCEIEEEKPEKRKGKKREESEFTTIA